MSAHRLICVCAAGLGTEWAKMTVNRHTTAVSNTVWINQHINTLPIKEILCWTHTHTHSFSP